MFEPKRATDQNGQELQLHMFPQMFNCYNHMTSDHIVDLHKSGTVCIWRTAGHMAKNRPGLTAKFPAMPWRAGHMTGESLEKIS